MPNQLLDNPQDLLLRVETGVHRGSIVAIKSKKTVLGLEAESLGPSSMCAIIRGSHGTAVRSFGDQVLINGVPTSAHWLKAGDRIELSKSFSAVVEQLGTIESEIATLRQLETISHASPQTDETQETQLQKTPENHGDAKMLPADDEFAVFEQSFGRNTPSLDSILDVDSGEAQSFSPASSLLETGDQGPVDSAATTEEQIVGFNPSEEDDEAEPFIEATILTPESNPTTDKETTINADTFSNHDSANETVDKSIDDLTHSQLVDGSSFADPKPTPGQTPEPEGTLASIDSLSQTIDEELSNDDKPKSESVAELLERMKSEGQWGGVPSDADDSEPVESAEAVEVIAEPEVNAAPVEDDDDVDSYMSRLLSRMRGETEPAPAPAVKSPAKPEQKKDEVEVRLEEEVVAPPLNNLTSEEFIPKQKAQRLESLGAMRALANSTARKNVKRSEDSRRKALGHAQIAIGVASFFMALYYILAGSERIGDSEFGIGVVCLIIAGFLAYRFYTTIVHNEQVDAEEAALAVAKLEAGSNAPPEVAPEVASDVEA